jgi:hypothetical protein
MSPARILVIAAGAALAYCASAAPDASMFPFVLPWNDSSPGITDVSAHTVAPAGQWGHIRAGEDGHLYAGDQRIRFFGVDLTFSAALPTHEQAEQVAARLAKFGVNIVRFHIIDSRRFPDGILARDGTDTRHLDPESRDRMDYFIAQLKRHGVYCNLNLLNYRPFNAADGLPPEINTLTTGSNQLRHVMGFFDDAVLGLQREYARELLTHINPYTGNAYVSEPCVAFVEINNENGLLSAWARGWLDMLPDVFTRQLQARWNQWLTARYATDERLKDAWQVGAEPLGAEMLTPGTDEQWKAWELQQNAGAVAQQSTEEDVPEAVKAEYAGARSLKITSEKRGTDSWHLLLNRHGFGLQEGHSYTLVLWAKASAPCSLGVSAYQTAPPWGHLGLHSAVNLTTEWQRFRFSFVANQDYPASRITFGDFAGTLGTYWLAGVSLRPGRLPGLEPGESLAAASIAPFTVTGGSARTPNAQADWRRFLWETEDAYWEGMYHYLKQDLGLKSLVIGTAVGYASPTMMAGLDVVDAHAYWQHPRFPGRPWDSNNWLIGQKSMVNERGGILAGLAMKRVLGKPRAVTEYCHPAPNVYGVEGYLLYAAYAALQDWDYISMSRYAQRNDYDIQRIRGYFDIDQHPAKMVTLVPASTLFTRGDVKPARELVTASLDKARELSLLAGMNSWQEPDASTCDVEPATALVHRVGIAVRREGAAPEEGATQRAPEPVPADATRYVSDTGELDWDISTPQRGVVTVNTSASKMMIGWGGGKHFQLGGIGLEPGTSMEDGWSAITLTAMTGSLDSGPARMLITATGNVENTDMGWKNPEHTTVGRDWGTAPTLAEGIPARVILPAPAPRVTAWVLDERGQRREALPVDAAGPDHAALNLGPQWRTLWYEVEVH